MLTARAEVADKVAGLDAGATDYMTKPFSVEELLARVRAHLRAPAQAETTRLSVAGIELDMLRRAVSRDGSPVHLSAKEFDLLAYFMRHPGQVLSREQILNGVWDYNHDPGTNIVEVYVGYLRRKLALADRPVPIQTVRSAATGSWTVDGPAGAATAGHAADRRGRGRLPWGSPSSPSTRDGQRAVQALAPGPAGGHGGARAGGHDRLVPTRGGCRARSRLSRPSALSPTSHVLFVVPVGGRPVSNEPELLGLSPPDESESTTQQRQENRAAHAFLTAPPGYSFHQLPDGGRISCSSRSRAATVERSPASVWASRRHPPTAPSARYATSSCSRARWRSWPR
jgi:hypothetical protein